MNEDFTIYDADYFLHGRQTGKSLYEDYRWMPELTIPMARAMARGLGIAEGQTILDFGCARGYTVKAFREIGYEAYGVDASQWAIDNCDPTVKGFVTCTQALPPAMDWIIAKDVLEHVREAPAVIADMLDSAREGVFVVVPLSAADGQPYIVPSYEADVTHIHRLTLATWVKMFLDQCGARWKIEAAYRFRGVKENYHGWATWVQGNYENWERGNGFITARRIK